MTQIRIGALVIFLACGAAFGWAASHYVRAGATGSANGSDWTNAWTDLPSTFVRGDTYYLAAGTYGAHVFNTADTGVFIYVKMATGADHGTATGWAAGYASGQAVFQTTTGILWNITTGHWDFDGVVGSGPGGQGIKLYDTSMNEQEPIVYVINGYSASYLNFRHVEFQGPGAGNSDPTRMFFVNATNTNNLTFQYDYFHETGKTWMTLNQNNANVLIERCYFRNCGSGDATMHSDGMSIYATTNINMIIRYNVFENMLGTANTTYIEPQGSGGSGIYVYGNVFMATSASEFTSQGIFSYTSSDYGSLVRIFNNTIYGLHSYNPGVSGTTGCTDIQVTNNVWQACSTAPSFPNVTAASNTLNTGVASFVNALIGDFHLTIDTAAGTTLASPYNADPDGTVRGSSGVWSIWAYQFAGLAITPPAIPTGFHKNP